MSLFPAYASESSINVEDSASSEEWCVPAALESQLLASDEEPAAKRARASPPAAPRAPPAAFYLDTEADRGHARVSTLYYPGRPEYRAGAAALGARSARARAPPSRYWQRAPPAAAAPEPRARAAELRAAAAAEPGDEERWLRYVEFERAWGARAAELDAARAAAAACDSERVRAALQRARERHLPRAGLPHELRGELARERRARVRLELWARLLDALGPDEGAAAAAAALAREPAPAAYPRLLYAHGCALRAAGLSERLVQLVELTAAMCFPPAPGFPPPRDAAADRRRDRRLRAREDEVCRSGLPPSAVWARVERLRAAAHWRPAAGADADADPQRAPDAAAAAELVRPARSERAAAALALALLRLARVPLAGGEAAARAAGPEPRAGEPALPEALAVLLRAARRLPPAHPARPAAPAAARAALAPLLDPPHYLSDADGYLAWTGALWEACCGWMRAERRLAFLCWRLRWLHALARLAEPAEARRLRHEARAAIKRHAPAAPEAFAHFARLEADVSGAAAGARAAAHALRAALREPAAPPERALFAARVLAELSAGGAASAPARWALCCAALRRALPPDAELEAAPPAALLAAALERCDERCAELERGFEAAADAEDEEEEDVCAALLPGAGEWGAARATLAAPARRARLLARLLAARRVYRAGAALQYGEQTACALALGAAGAERARAAHLLLPMFPRNPLLALMCGGAPLWAGGAGGACVSERAALAAVVPRLLRAPPGPQQEAGEARRLAAACARLAAAGGGGALLAALRLEAEARAPAHRTPQALFAALDAHPDHKWVYVRGAAWAGADAGALADALLERGLRLHALLDELPTLAADLPTVATDPPTVAADLPTVATDAPTLAADLPTVATDAPTVAADLPTVATDPPTVAADPPTVAADPPTVAADPPSVAADPPTVAADLPAVT